MEALLQSLLAESHGLLAYLTVFGILLVCGLGVPLPEDLSLILGGYLAHQGAASFPIMMGVGFIGILVGDSLIYAIGRRVGLEPGKGGLLARIITPEKRALVAHMFERHGRKVVMIARFMPGLRAVTYFTAGSVRMPYLQFIFWDGLAALVSAPFFVWLGFRFGDEMDALVARVKDGQMAAITILVLLGATFLLYRFVRNRRRARVATLLQRTTETARALPVAPSPLVLSTPTAEEAEEQGAAAGTNTVRPGASSPFPRQTPAPLRVTEPVREVAGPATPSKGPTRSLRVEAAAPIRGRGFNG